MGFFDDLLKTINNEQEAAVIRETLGKNPETKKHLDQIESLAKNGQTYLSWYKDPSGWPAYENAFKELPTARTQLAEAQKTIDKLTREVGGQPPARVNEEPIDMSEMTKEQFDAAVNAQVQAAIKAAGYITVDDAKKMADTAAIEAAGKAKASVYTHGLPLVERMIALSRKYESDFKNPDGTVKAFDRKGFGEFIEKNQIADPDVAYQQFTAQEYLEKEKANAFAQGQIQGAKEAEERLNKERNDAATRSLPVDMTGTAVLGQTPGAAPAPVELDKVPEDYQLGRKGGFQLAHAVAAQVKKDRAAGKQV